MAGFCHRRCLRSAARFALGGSVYGIDSSGIMPTNSITRKGADKESDGFSWGGREGGGWIIQFSQFNHHGICSEGETTNKALFCTPSSLK